jgi:hypothetical protein
MNLPEVLLHAVADVNGGKIVIVTGAGVSLEAPTAIPLASQCAQDAHDRLVADGILSPGECATPWDLSALADLVVSKKGSQTDLVKRLPIEAMRLAKPNDGHLIAIGLMIEGAISNIMTLNYDLAFTNAMTKLGVPSGISIIRGPEDHDQLGSRNIIYLHRSVDAEKHTWVLTTKALDEAWKNGWEEIMVGFAAIAPVVIFAGLGSSCGVLTHTSKKIRNAAGDGVFALLVGPNAPESSQFATETRIAPANCIRSGWVDFMRSLGHRYLVRIGTQIVQTSKMLARREGWVNADGNSTEDVKTLVDQLMSMGIIAFATVRARWHLSIEHYVKTDDRQIESIADILIAVCLVERLAGVKSLFLDCGRVLFSSDSKESAVVLVSGSGSLRWGSLESTLKHCEKYLQSPRPRHPAKRILAVEVSGIKPEHMATPESIIDSREENDLVRCGDKMRFFSVDEIRMAPALVQELLS